MWFYNLKTRLFGEKRKNFRESLANSDLYVREIERMHSRFSKMQKLYTALQDGVSFAQISMRRKHFAKLLAKPIAKGLYEPGTAERRSINVEGKTRTIYSLSLTDRMLHGAIYQTLSDAAAEFASPHVYSYTKGRDRMDALSAFADYVRAHIQRYATPQQRGFFVIRSDIKSYGESIPVHPRSALWQLLRDFLDKAYPNATYTEADWKLLKQVVAPIILSQEGYEYCNLYGIPDGSPVSALLLNLYNKPIDDALSAIEGAFYARFGDDFLFAHEDADVVKTALTNVDALFKKLELRRNIEKSKVYYFNGAGRNSEKLPEAKGTTLIEFLGCAVNFKGDIRLKSEKLRKLLQDLRIRARSTSGLLKDSPNEERGPIICNIINHALNPKEADCHPLVLLLTHCINDRQQLQQIDYMIARLVLRAVTGSASVKAFRTIPYNIIRKEWGLLSLEHMRNKGYR